MAKQRNRDAPRAGPTATTAKAKPPAAPPALFLGRDRELARAREALARRRLLVVWGLGGLGKSAFLRALLAPAVRRRAVELRAVKGAGLSELARSLRAIWGGHASSSKDDEAMAAAILELAEKNDATVIVDDAHLLAPDAFGELLRVFAGHEGAATLLASTRLRPDLPELAEQLVQLQPLDRASIAALVRACGPDLSDDARERIAERALGSPWLARCLATGHHLSGTGRLTDDLDQPTRRALAALRWIDGTVPERVIEDLTGATRIATALVSRALVERIGEEIRLHDVAREMLAELEPLDPEVGRAALGCVESMLTPAGGSGACVALELAAALEDAPSVSRILSAHASKLLEQGLAERSWRALSTLPDDQEVEFRLACAASCAARDAIEWALLLGRPQAVRAQVSWAECLNAGGRRNDAKICLSEVAAGSDPAAALDAAALLARMARSREEAQGALRALGRQGLAKTGPPGLALALQARSLLYLDRPEEALDHTLRAAHELAPPGAFTAPAATLVFSTLVTLGRYADAAPIANQLFRHVVERDMASSALYVAALHALETGDLAATRRRISLLSRRRGHVETRFLLSFLTFRLAYCEGDRNAACLALRDLQTIAGTAHHPEVALWVRVAVLQVALWTGEPAPRWEWPADMPSHSGPNATILEVLERRERRARGESVRHDDLTIPPGALDLRLFHAELEADCLIDASDPQGASRVLEAAIALARQHHSTMREMELLEALAHSTLAAGDAARSATTGKELEAVAVAVGVPRFIAAGRELSSAGRKSPSMRFGLFELERDSREARLPGGKLVSLAGNELGFRILEELVRAQGRATKSELTIRVWERKRYHPQRDDKRLQVAVRRLRVLIEEDPARPAVLVTTPDGYALSSAAGLSISR